MSVGHGLCCQAEKGVRSLRARIPRSRRPRPGREFPTPKDGVDGEAPKGFFGEQDENIRGDFRRVFFGSFHSSLNSDSFRLAWQDYVVQGVLDRIVILASQNPAEIKHAPPICPPEQIYQADRKVRSHHGDLDPKLLVASRLENEQDVDALAVLEELDSANIEPTADTFAFLAEAFAVKGDINGVKSVVSLMKDSGIPVSEKVLQSMVYALTHSGDRTQAAGVIKAFESHASISAFNLRLAEIRALAALGDLQGVVEVVADIASDQRMKTSDTQALLMHALCQLVIKGKHDAVERLKPFITRFSEESKEPGMAEKVYLLRLLRETLVKRDYESAAVLDSLFGSSFEDSRTFTFMKHLKSSVNDRNVEPSTLYKRSSIVKSLGHGEQPFLVVMERALIENNRKLFNDLYSLLVVDEDFTEMLVERPHLAYPLAVKLVNQIHSAASVEVKSQKCLELCKLLFSQSQGIDFDAANNFVFRAVEKGHSFETYRGLAHCKQFRNSIACSIVDRMMMRSKNLLLQAKTNTLTHDLRENANRSI
ncbi:hypothetical protein L596_028133 [Steinernema carpocapsae]|uniref:Pentatricopeptide repeat-containing protein-mitochondrial domain-containing protein n=1 Tax=Steinernema carpocapsae TaxID=34508 RepID=A0A4U5LXM7_STECR|nr:hypothetical protein L596_028133 [Steinernema carpocapsae]